MLQGTLNKEYVYKFHGQFTSQISVNFNYIKFNNHMEVTQNWEICETLLMQNAT